MKYAPCGGVRGAPLTREQITRAHVAIKAMPQAVVQDGALAGQTVIVAGNSPTLNDVAPERLNRYPIIGCNRGLRKRDLRYTHLVIGDREPYCQERDSGRLAAFSEMGGVLFLTDSLFDPTVLLRGGGWQTNPNRLTQPTPDFHAYVYKIGTLGKKNAQAKVVSSSVKGLKEGFLLNFDTFRNRVESCLNVAGSMIQVAAIMKPARVIFVGIELKWPKDEKKSHFFGSGRKVGAYPQNESTMDYVSTCMRWARDEFRRRGVEVLNLSPVKDSPFAKVFGNYPIRKFV